MSFAHAENKTTAKNLEKKANAISQLKKTGTPQTVSQSFEHVLQLQRTLGNQAVRRLIETGSVQAKLKISQPNDVYEQEAERVAEQLMQKPEPQFNNKVIVSSQSSFIHPELIKSKPRKETKVEFLLTKEASGFTAEAALDSESYIGSIRSGGQPLPEPVRAFFEQRFVHDFNSVRIHTDTHANESARAVNALAYAIGRDIVFASGEYAPQSGRGRRLLAHELAHTLQQANISNVLQRQKAERSWESEVMRAEKAAEKKNTMPEAESIYRDLIVRAAAKVPVPTPLKPVILKSADVVFDWTKKVKWAATTDNKKISKEPKNYWKWITFNPYGVLREEVATVSGIAHELDHAAHGKTLYEQWKTAPGKKTAWPDFWVAHTEKWEEPKIKLTKIGVFSGLEGFPDKIAPSAIEFRAYASQFVSFFHKSSTSQQEFLAKGVVLFYPLKKQTVREKIKDPALDLAKAKQQIINYFNNPPVRDVAQKKAIQTLMASNFRYAFLLRVNDMIAIKEAFKPISDLKVSPKDVKDARALYKPAAL